MCARWSRARRARGHKLIVGGELYSDALGTPGTYEGTLIGMLDHNVTTIVRALGGEAPVRGMAGRLQGRGLTCWLPGRTDAGTRSPR